MEREGGELMALCSANKHDLDVVGMVPPSPSRRGYGTCRACHNERKQKSRAVARRAWELPEVYEMGTDMLIVDEVAIERACNAGRLWMQETSGIVPWITETEARIAALRMDARGVEIEYIADNIGCSVSDVESWLRDLERLVAA